MNFNARVDVNCGRKDGRTVGRTDGRTDEKPDTFGLNNIYFIILYMYNYYIATRNDTQYNEWDIEESQ